MQCRTRYLDLVKRQMLIESSSGRAEVVRKFDQIEAFYEEKFGKPTKLKFLTKFKAIKSKFDCTR